MRADTKPYPPASVVGAIVLSRLGVPLGHHALDIEAVGLGNRPTRPIAEPRRVQKGNPLWHSPLDKPGRPRPDLLKKPE